MIAAPNPMSADITYKSHVFNIKKDNINALEKSGQLEMGESNNEIYYGREPAWTQLLFKHFFGDGVGFSLSQGFIQMSNDRARRSPRKNRRR